MVDQSTAEAAVGFEFRRFQVLPRRRELLADGKPVKVGNRAFDLLMALIESQGLLVTRDELLTRVWRNTHVDRNSLEAQVSALRKALGDDRDAIVTLPGRGYRLAAEICPIAAEPETLHSPRGRPTNIPAPISDFIGREVEIDRVADLIATHRIVTIAGAGGIGKTRLSLEIARRLLPSFDDGIWLSELARISGPHLLPAVVAAALDLPPRHGVSAEGLAAAIRPKRLLLLLDNCEHVVEAAAHLTDTLLRGAPELRVLATSQEPLGIEGECVYRLSPLGLPAEDRIDDEAAMRHGAVRLFVARAQAAAPHFAINASIAPSIVAICRRLDGIPLAIELAAARTATLGIDRIVSGLDDRFALLNYGRRAAAPRHKTLRAMLDWSYGLLAEDERAVLRRLAVFRGNFALPAASAVAADGAVDESRIADILTNLVTKSLVIAEGAADARYRLLETTRNYALLKLADTGEVNAALYRHAEYYRRLLEAANTPWDKAAADGWPAAYAPEVDNIRAAIDWVFSPAGDMEIGIALVAASTSLWARLSLFGECERYVRKALAAIDAAAGIEPRWEMQLQAALGMSIVPTKGRIAEKAAASRRALEIADRLGDAEYQARILINLYRSHRWDREASRSYAQAFLDLARARDHRTDILTGDALLGQMLLRDGFLAEARPRIQHFAETALADYDHSQIFRFGADLRVTALSNYALVLWLQGYAEQAIQHARFSIETARGADQVGSLCFALANSGCFIASAVGDVPMAARAAAALRDLVDRYALGFGHYDATFLGAAFGATHDDPTVRLAEMRSALADPGEMWVGHLIGIYFGWFAEALGQAGRVEEALKVVREGISVSNDYGEIWCLPELHRIEGSLLVRRNGTDDATLAEDCFRKALSLARQHGALAWELRVAIDLARVWLQQGRRGPARELLEMVCGRFTEGFGTADFQAATILARAI